MGCADPLNSRPVWQPFGYSRGPRTWAPTRDGAPIAIVAKRLHLSEGTVRNHLSSAIGKTGAATRAEAVRIADGNGWL